MKKIIRRIICTFILIIFILLMIRESVIFFSGSFTIPRFLIYLSVQSADAIIALLALMIGWIDDK